MPRRTKAGRRVADDRKPLVKPAPPLAAAPVVLPRTRRPTASAVRVAPDALPAQHARASEIEQSLPVTGTSEMPGHRLFWAWYAAGVDTIRVAFDMQSAFVNQLFEASPASLAVQVHTAFHHRALA